MDIEALYPSIHQKDGPRIVAEEIIRSDLRYEGVDVRKAAIYLAATLSKERQTVEGIGHLLPQRKAQGRPGRKPLYGPRNWQDPCQNQRLGRRKRKQKISLVLRREEVS